MRKRIKETIRVIRRKTDMRPEALIILGSGLGSIGDRAHAEVSFRYEDIPYFKKTSVPTHKGILIFGRLSAKKVMLMQGRFHLYEGYKLSEVTYPVEVAAKLGVKLLITISLAGGINANFRLGDFVLVRDHLNLSGDNPLIGFKNQKDKIPFVDMYAAYSLRLIQLLKQTTRDLGLRLKEGVLAHLTGPSFETPAELRFLKLAGADAVGWSMVPEVIVARALGMEVLGILCISDLANPNQPRPVNLNEIFKVGLERADALYRLLAAFLAKL